MPLVWLAGWSADALCGVFSSVSWVGRLSSAKTAAVLSCFNGSSVFAAFAMLKTAANSGVAADRAFKGPAGGRSASVACYQVVKRA